MNAHKEHGINVKLICIILLAIAVLLIVILACKKTISLHRAYKANMSASVDEKFLQHSYTSMTAINTFLPYLEDPQKNDSTHVSSELYGGCYINTEGKLVLEIAVKNYSDYLKSGNFRNSFLKITELTNKDVYFRYVKHSYNELSETMESLNQLFHEGRVLALCSWGIDEYNNCVTLEVSEHISPDELNLILDVIGDVKYTISYGLTPSEF